MKIRLDLENLSVESFEAESAAISPAQKTYSALSCFFCDWVSEMVC